MDPNAALPSVITTYQEAHDRHDVPTALDQFTPDAVVTDEDRTYRGTAGVDTFLRTAAAEFTFTRTLVNAVEVGPDEWVVTNHLEGDFPGGVVDLRYRFRLAGDLISHLEIAP